MKRKLLIAAALAAMMSGPALAFNPIDWVMKEAVEDAAKEAAKDAVVNTIKGGSANKTQPKPKAPVAVSVPPGQRWWFLPTTGAYRFAMPEDTAWEDLAIGPNGGYVDRFGNEWVPVLNSRKSHIVRWEEHLSNDGAFRLGGLVRGERLIVVSVNGEIIRPEGSKTSRHP